MLILKKYLNQQLNNQLGSRQQKSEMSGQRIVKKDSEISQQQQRENLFQRQESRLNSLVQMRMMKKQTLGISFSGIIRSGVFKNDYTLSVQFAFYAGEDWELVGGQPSGISFKSSCSQQKIIWNFPFGITYQAKNIVEWPQIVLIIYGTDHFGRSMPRGYGNMHLPTSSGKHNRKIRIFRTLQPSSCWSCFNFLTSSILQIKQPEKYLGNGKERKFLKTQYSGQVQVEIETNLFNLERHGYS